MEDARITTGLDVLALLLLAGGLGAGVAQWVGWFGAAVAGAVVLAGSQLAVYAADERARAARAARRTARREARRARRLQLREQMSQGRRYLSMLAGKADA